MACAGQTDAADPKSLFVELVCNEVRVALTDREGRPSIERTEMPACLVSTIADSGPLQCVLIGDVGGGKSTSLLRLAALAAAKAEKNPDAAIPVFVDLAYFRGTSGLADLMQLVGARIGAGVDAKVFETAWRTGSRRFLLLFDSLNEVPDEYRASCGKQWSSFFRSEPIFTPASSPPAGAPQSSASSNGRRMSAFSNCGG